MCECARCWCECVMAMLVALICARRGAFSVWEMLLVFCGWWQVASMKPVALILKTGADAVAGHIWCWLCLIWWLLCISAALFGGFSELGPAMYFMPSTSTPAADICSHNSNICFLFPFLAYVLIWWRCLLFRTISPALQPSHKWAHFRSYIWFFCCKKN